MRLCVDLRGNKPLPGAALAQNQDRAIGFGNPGDRVLSARLGSMGGSRLPFSIVDHCNCCHLGTKLHVVFSTQVPNLTVEYAEYTAIAGYGLGGGETLSWTTLTKGVESFPPIGKQCTINCLG